MKFTKMQGLGNDYVYVNCFQEKIDNPPEVAIKVSNRNFGVGSDGLIMINPSKVADFEMEMYNADGSRGEMCGNGIRCVGKYVYDYGLTDKTSISVETLGGIKYLDFTVENGKVKLVKVDMGSPELVPANIPIVADAREACEKIAEYAEENEQKEWLDKLDYESRQANKEFWWLVFSFKETDKQMYVVCDNQVFQDMVATMVSDRKVAKEAQLKIDIANKAKTLSDKKNTELQATIDRMQAEIDYLKTLIKGDDSN